MNFRKIKSDCLCTCCGQIHTHTLAYNCSHYPLQIFTATPTLILPLSIFIFSVGLSRFDHFIGFFFLFRAALAAYTGSQARGPIRAVAPAYTTATATADLSCICDLHHSLRQHQFPKTLSEARDQTHILMDISQVYFHWATMGTWGFFFFFNSTLGLIYSLISLSLKSHWSFYLYYFLSSIFLSVVF